MSPDANDVEKPNPIVPFLPDPSAAASTAKRSRSESMFLAKCKKCRPTSVGMAPRVDRSNIVTPILASSAETRRLSVACLIRSKEAAPEKLRMSDAKTQYRSAKVSTSAPPDDDAKAGRCPPSTPDWHASPMLNGLERHEVAIFVDRVCQSLRADLIHGSAISLLGVDSKHLRAR